MIRVVLPYHLRTLAGVTGEVVVDVAEPASVRRVLDALEARHPALRGTTRDHATGERRPFVRFYAAGEDLSLTSPDAPLPTVVRTGAEPLLIIGAMAGG